MIFSYLLNMQSHPSWVCGLKQRNTAQCAGRTQSHPSWVCGLKLEMFQSFMAPWCHTLRGCVD